MGQAQGQPARSARCIALVGPYLSGKTTLLEAILARTGAITRQGSMAGRQYGGRRLGGGAASRHERRAQRRHRRFPRRQLHLPRLPGLDRIPGRRGQRAHGLRRRGGGVRARREEGAGAAADPQAARGSRHSAFPVHQQDRQGRGARARHRADAAAGLDQAAGAAADPDLGERHRHRLHRSRAGARLRLSRACAERGDRHSRRRSPSARRKRASPCWRSSPITTTS